MVGVFINYVVIIIGIYNFIVMVLLVIFCNNNFYRVIYLYYFCMGYLVVWR